MMTATNRMLRCTTALLALSGAAGCAMGELGWPDTGGTPRDSATPARDSGPSVSRDGGASDTRAPPRDAAITPGRDSAVPPMTECTTGATRECYSGAGVTRSVGRCRPGAQSCDASGRWPTACAGEVLPATSEQCANSIDDDCNGMVDEACSPEVPSDVQRSCGSMPVAGCGLVEVAGGAFQMGDTMALFSAPVLTSVRVSGAMRVDAYEVTVARFRRFWAAGHPVPRDAIRYPSTMLPAPVAAPEPETTASQSQCNWTATPGSRESHPINCLEWQTAQSFCAWDGGRLPTEAEWEWVARGRTVPGVAAGRSFPWGDEEPASTPACDRAQFALCAGEDGAPTRHVGSFAATGSIYDLAGNVGEFTADVHRMYDDTSCWGTIARTDPLCVALPAGFRAVRGGDWTEFAPVLIRSASRSIGVTGQASVGFRCVRAR